MNAAQKRITIKHEPAIWIRELLDKARVTYGAQDWDNEELATLFLEVVTEEAQGLMGHRLAGL
jgi:hypothetical protein